MTRVVFLTDRGARHAEEARRAAPTSLELIILRRPAPAELEAALAGAEVIVSERNQTVTAAMIDAAPRLSLILRLGSLIHDVDVDHARKRRVRISMQPARASVQAAEHVLMMILALLRRLCRSLAGAGTATRPPQRTDEDHFAYNWNGFSELDSLCGKTVSILGMGEIGVELARRLAPFGVERIYYHKRTPYPERVERELGIERAKLEPLLSAADVLVSLLPYAPETLHAISASVLGLLPPRAVLVHAGSGGVIGEAALVSCLEARKLAGAALDTFEEEPLPRESPLLRLARDPNSNLLLTPHVASGNLPDTRAEDFEEILRHLRGEPLRYEI